MISDVSLGNRIRQLRDGTIGHDRWFFLLWVLSSAMVVALAVALTWQAGTHLLRYDAQAVARAWVEDLKASVDDLDRILTTGFLSPASRNALLSAGEGHEVTFFRLYNYIGQPIYQSLSAQEQPSFTVLTGGAVGGPLHGDRSASAGGADSDGADAASSIHGRIVLPIKTDGGIQGMAEVYLDQSAKAEFYRQAFLAFVGGLALLILVAMALPMTMVWRKSKERELAERRLQDLAHTDPLTGLGNRTHFRERLDEALAIATSGEQVTALFWLDLDRFKTINDALGHPIGDALLCQVAERLKHCLSDEGTIARLGGDEFALLFCGSLCENEAARLAQRLIQVLAVPFDVEGHHVVIGVSIGVVFAPRDGNATDDLLKKADIALYRAKDAGRSTYRFFTQDMEARSVVRHSLEEDLRDAIANNRLRLHYQPQVSLKSARIVGFEALLRWHHPDYGHMPPHEVIGLAEETGLIMPLGFWALKQATMDATTWPDDVSVSVNISAVQFGHTNLVDLVGDVLSMSGLAPDRLDLEITESIVMADSRTTISKLRKLRRLGIHLSMDDFGTGYSSLNRLRNLPFDRLKVDRSFIRELGGNRDDAAIVHAIVTLGKSLGMQVIAEGVETDMQLAHLHVENCDVAQGYYFGRPVPATEIGRQLGLYNPNNSVGLHAPRKPPLQLRPSWPEAERRSIQAPMPVEESSAIRETVN